MSAQPAVPLFPWLFLVLFLGLWALMSFAVSWMGGWRKLARDYRLEKGGGFPCSTFVSGEVGWVEYRGSLTLGGDARGLYLAVLFPFRLGHPPLCIPWSDVQDRVRERRFFFQWDTFRVGPDGVKLRFRSNALKPLEGYLPPLVQA